jgi:hypothetical protein
MIVQKGKCCDGDHESQITIRCFDARHSVGLLGLLCKGQPPLEKIEGIQGHNKGLNKFELNRACHICAGIGGFGVNFEITQPLLELTAIQPPTCSEVLKICRHILIDYCSSPMQPDPRQNFYIKSFGSKDWCIVVRKLYGVALRAGDYGDKIFHRFHC